MLLATTEFGPEARAFIKDIRIGVKSALQGDSKLALAGNGEVGNLHLKSNELAEQGNVLFNKTKEEINPHKAPAKAGNDVAQIDGSAIIEGGVKLHTDDLIIRDIDGKIIKVKYTQLHHAIHQSLKGNPLWDLAGMHVDDPLNLMLLPTKEGALKWNTTRSIHEGRHTGDIARGLDKKMNDVVDKGKIENWNKDDYTKALQKIINEEGALLRTGERALNKNKQPWANK